MIQAILLDVDGVIVGEKIGFNSPHPHEDVLERLKKIHEKGISVVLCTGKPYYAILEIIKKAHLNNPHIAEGGGIIIDPIDNIVIQKYIIEKDIAKEVLEECIKNGIYVEFYTQNDYFVQKNQVSGITEKHEHILQKGPTVVSSLSDESASQDIIKIMPIALNEEDKIRVAAILEKYREKLSIGWGLHPVALPLQFCLITVLGSSKKEAVGNILKNLNVLPENALGIGDSKLDWNFMELCGYGATLTNGVREIQELVRSKGEGKYYIGKSVDENGILDIFDYFHL